MSDPDGFGLACNECGHIFPLGVTMGVTAAHMEIEHGQTDDEVKLELVVLCPRCSKAMSLFYDEPVATGRRLHYECVPCHRVRRINQAAEAGR